MKLQPLYQKQSIKIALATALTIPLFMSGFISYCDAADRSATKFAAAGNNLQDAYNDKPIKPDGIHVGESHPQLYPISETLRYAVRDATKMELLEIFSQKKDFDSAFRNFKPKVLPPTVQQLASDTILFIPNQPFSASTGQELLGRYDVLAVPAKMDYNGRWEENPQTESRFLIHEAAAINIGESAHAADYKDYENKNGSLDEPRYLNDMGLLFNYILEAQEQCGVTDAVWFPMGMGAFLRNLPLMDPAYNDQALYELREKIAKKFIETLNAHPKLNIHICLPTGKPGEQSTQNYNAFVRAIQPAPKAVIDQIKIYINVDSSDLAQRLADKASNPKNVSMVNGANRTLIGNRWFADRALQAIDENLHRRSSEVATMALILNAGIDKRKRSETELSDRVTLYGGTVVHLN